MDNELYKSVLTASLTLVGGVILLVVTQIFTHFVIDPLLDFRRLLGEVTNTLIFSLLSCICVVPRREAVYVAAGHLIGLSNIASTNSNYPLSRKSIAAWSI